MITKTKISDRVSFYTSSSGLTNGTIIESEKGIVIVDSMIVPKDSKAFYEEIKKIGKPIKYLINTHWHSDHCYGNRFIAEKETIIIAHQDYLETLKAEKEELGKKSDYITDQKNLIFPQITFSNSLTLDMGFNIEIHNMPGHSFDSIIVYLPEEKILIAGDTILNSDGIKLALPYFYWGDIDLLCYSLEKIGMYDIELIIPGHGVQVTPDKIRFDLTYLNNLKELFYQFLSKNKNLELIDLQKSVLDKIILEECLPGAKKEDFWVTDIHKFNLQKLLKEM